MEADNRQAAWDLVDRSFHVEQIFGSEGADVIRRGAGKSSVHEFPYSLCLQAALLGCVNGAGVAAWPGRATPLSLVVLVANPQQTRKSQLMNCMTEIGREVDAVCRERAGALGLTTDQGNLHSLVLSTFTEAAFFQRASGGFHQHTSGARLHYSTLLCIDEAYRLLGMLGLTSDGGKQQKNAPCDNASQWNTLLQTGQSSLATKTGVSYQSDQPVNLVGCGNLHLGPLTAMLRGQSGQHEAAALERILLCSGRPIAPHAPLAESLQLPEHAERLLWAPLLSTMCEPLGLPEAVLKEETAKEAFADTWDEEDGSCSVWLADGTQTRIRFRSMDAWTPFCLR